MMKQAVGGLVALVLGVGAVGAKALINGDWTLGFSSAAATSYSHAVPRLSQKDAQAEARRRVGLGAALTAPAGGVTAHQTAERKRAEADFIKGNHEAARGQYAKAVPHWEAAANRGHEVAAWRLGVIYVNGERGVLPNRRKAEDWLARGVALNHGPSALLMGDLSQGQPVAAARYYLAAVEAGEVEAAFRAAELYAAGPGLLDRDPEMAAELYQLAAEQDHPAAMHRLAAYLVTGEGGVTPDPARAAEYLRKSAEQGYPPAQLGYAQFLMTTPDEAMRNPVEGYAWAVLAWQGEQAGAEAFLKRAREQLSEEQLAESQERVARLPIRR